MNEKLRFLSERKHRHRAMANVEILKWIVGVLLGLLLISIVL